MSGLPRSKLAELLSKLLNHSEVNNSSQKMRKLKHLFHHVALMISVDFHFQGAEMWSHDLKWKTSSPRDSFYHIKYLLVTNLASLMKCDCTGRLEVKVPIGRKRKCFFRWEWEYGWEFTFHMHVVPSCHTSYALISARTFALLFVSVNNNRGGAHANRPIIPLLRGSVPLYQISCWKKTLNSQSSPSSY